MGDIFSTNVRDFSTAPLLSDDLLHLPASTVQHGLPTAPSSSRRRLHDADNHLNAVDPRDRRDPIGNDGTTSCPVQAAVPSFVLLPPRTLWPVRGVLGHRECFHVQRARPRPPRRLSRPSSQSRPPRREPRALSRLRLLACSRPAAVHPPFVARSRAPTTPRDTRPEYPLVDHPVPNPAQMCSTTTRAAPRTTDLPSIDPRTDPRALVIPPSAR